LKHAILVDLQYRYPQDVQALLDMSAFLDPPFKDLDPFVDVAGRVDVEEAVKLEALKLAEEIAVTVDDVDDSDILLDEMNDDQPQN